MRPVKEHAPYSLYKKKTKSGLLWYVRFWNDETKTYDTVRSTGIQVEGKRERWREADDTAKAILEELKQESVKQAPSINEAVFPVEPPTLSEVRVQEEEITPLPETKVDPPKVQCEADTPLIQYLLGFWSSESEYVKYKRDVKKKPLCAYYVQMNHDDVTRHIASFPDFQGITLGELNRKLLKKWLIWMASKKVIHKKKDGTQVEGNLISGRRINSILQGMRVAVRWAVDNESLDTDPFRNLDEAADEPKEKGILTPDELKRLIALPVKDPYARLAVLLAARCGLRRGEVRGLKWGDIRDGIIMVQHNFVNTDGLKAPKIKGGTIVKNSNPVPLPSDVEAVLEILKEISGKTGENDFVMQSLVHPGKVVSAEYFRSAFARELQNIGIDEAAQKSRNLTYHGLRHTYVTHGRLSGLNDFEIQTLARQKSKVVMERYSHGKQAIDFLEARKKLEVAVNAETDEPFKISI